VLNQEKGLNVENKGIKFETDCTSKPYLQFILNYVYITVLKYVQTIFKIQVMKRLAEAECCNDQNAEAQKYSHFVFLFQIAFI